MAGFFEVYIWKWYYEATGEGEGLPPTQGDVDVPPDDEATEASEEGEGMLGVWWRNPSWKGHGRRLFSGVHLKIILFYVVKT